jgi:hypothetical protein
MNESISKNGPKIQKSPPVTEEKFPPVKHPDRFPSPSGGGITGIGGILLHHIQSACSPSTFPLIRPANLNFQKKEKGNNKHIIPS